MHHPHAGRGNTLKTGRIGEQQVQIYFGDTKLLVAMLDDEASDDLHANRSLGVCKGALYESIVGETPCKSGYDLCC